MMKRYDFKHVLKYVKWSKEATLEKGSTEQFGDLLESLIKKGFKQIDTKTIRYNYLNKGYYIEKVGNWKRLYYYDNDWKIFSTNVYDENKNKEEKNFNKQALVILKEKFSELTGLGKKCFSQAFGTTTEEFKNCVPKQFYYMNSNFITKSKDKARFDSTFLTGIDDSSHYPSCGCGRLPDANTALTIKGHAEPSEEYPFAFYLKSGMCAEYGVFDMRDWVEDPKWGPHLFTTKRWLEGKFYYEDETTVLMKASQYELTQCWRYFYDKRKEDADAKLVMNSAIGQMHQRTEGWKRYERFPYAHIAAVIIARANQKHLKTIKKIGDDRIVQVCVDGIIYKYSGLYAKDPERKDLGVYVNEFKMAHGVFKSTNCYVIQDVLAKKFKIRLSGYNAYKDGRPLVREEFDGRHPEVMWDLIKIDKTDKRGQKDGEIE